ncbi:TPA: hypothetical protein NJZ43_002795 [Vibrio parahaemolyticus]|nr:hypothetical protein [Vibrio parahaemolyticus]HCG5316152.1 hypothetical protein [Vibrio parahaemolyticus]HCG5320964.1 hypothetical protein [Vibrio parahaemolyticus]
MADKFFKLTCNKKVSHKAVKESGNPEPVILFIKAATQKQAKADAESIIEAKHPLCTDFEGHTYSDCFKGAIIDAISEEEYNLGIISEECTYGLDDEALTEEFQETIQDKPYPALGNDGFYDAQDAEVSQAIYNSTDENMQAAKVFVLNVGHGQWSHGFRCTFGAIDKHERMNLDRVEETRSQAINAVIDELKSYAKNALDFVGDDQKPFLSFVLEHNFNYEFWESSEKFIHAVKKHPAYEDAAAAHQEFAEVVESHFADIWPLDEAAEPAIEKVNSMENIDKLYELDVFQAFIAPLLAPYSEKTMQTMSRLEDAFSKSAANDSEVEQKCWKAALEIDDSRYATLAVKDCGDSGWAHACALFKDKQCVFGDDSVFSDEFEIDRKSAISKAVSSITEVMYKFGVDTDVVSEFARNYLQRFEENCIELGVDESLPEDEPKLKTAIRERLKMRPGNVETKENEVEDDFQIVNAFVTESTDVDGLLEAILALPHCKPLFNEQDAKKLVEQFSTIEATSTKSDYDGYVRKLLSIAGEIEGVDDSMIDEIKGKLSGVFGEREFNLQDGEFYSEAASHLMNYVRSMNAPLLPELLNLRVLRRLVDDAMSSQNTGSGKNAQKEPTHNLDNEHKTQKPEVKYPTLLQAITDRLENENTKVTPENAYSHLVKLIKENTNIDGLAEYIKQLKNPVIIWHSPESVNMVMKFTNKDPNSGNNEPKEPQSLPEQGKNKPKVTSNGQKVTKQDPLPQSANDELIADSDSNTNGSDVPQNIVEQEPANDPEIPDVDLDESNSNMDIWNQSFKTDLNFTKQDPSTGRLSINAQYRQMKATEIFGPRGKGWGVDVKREWLEDGLPIFANGTYTGVNESVHNMEVELWYIHPSSGERCTVTAFGETERFYWSHNYSRMIKNGECRKKSLTDATGKALSMLGICGDVYMGEYDDENIINRSQMTKTTDNALKKLEFDAQATQQALDKAKSYTDKFSTAPSLAEIKRLQKLAETALDAIPTHDNASKAKKDKALARIAEQAQSAIKDFNSDIKDKDQANG